MRRARPSGAFVPCCSTTAAISAADSARGHAAAFRPVIPRGTRNAAAVCGGDLGARQQRVAPRGKALRQQAGRLGWVGDDRSVAQRKGSGDVPIYLCHQRGATEDTQSSLLQEPTQRGEISCRGITDDAVNGRVCGASFASRMHRADVPPRFRRKTGGWPPHRRRITANSAVRSGLRGATGPAGGAAAPRARRSAEPTGAALAPTADAGVLRCPGRRP